MHLGFIEFENVGNKVKTKFTKGTNMRKAVIKFEKSHGIYYFRCCFMGFVELSSIKQAKVFESVKDAKEAVKKYGGEVEKV